VFQFFFFNGAAAPTGPAPYYSGFMITLRHTILGRLLWTSDHPTQRSLPDNTTLTRDRLPWSRRASNMYSQKASSRRPTL